MNIKPYVEKEKEYIVDLRRHFHKNSEVSMKEYRTAEKIRMELDRHGIENRLVGETGVLGIIRGKKGPGRRIALRADIDALSMRDEKTVDYASANEGAMHACGHDAHTSALLGAAKILRGRADELCGEIYLFFQQGEEICQGAREFIAAGLLSGVDRVFGLHVAPNVPVGSIALSAGPIYASVDRLIIRIKGESAHVSTPHLGVDALYIASQLVDSLQSVVSRQTDPFDPVVVGIGILRAGTAYNIVANEAYIEGTIRCFTPDLREKTKESIIRMAHSVAKAHGGSAEIEIDGITPSLINPAEALGEAWEIASQIVGAENVIEAEKSLGGDDFAEFLQICKGTYAIVGTGNPETPNTLLPLHSNMFDIDEQGLIIAANLYADYALSVAGGV